MDKIDLDKTDLELELIRLKHVVEQYKETIEKQKPDWFVNGRIRREDKYFEWSGKMKGIQIALNEINETLKRCRIT